MKLHLLSLLAIACYCSEGQIAPRGALLVLPSQARSNSTPANSTAPVNKTAVLSTVNAAVIEQIRQDAGSESGVYHVYLPDGRLQRVEYTVLSLTDPTTKQNVSSSSNSSQKVDVTVRDGKSVFLVEAPKSVEDNKASPNCNNAQTAGPDPLFFVPLAVVRSNQLGKEADLNKASGTQGAGSQARSQEAADRNSPTYVASVQLSEIKPVSGPVYSYSPQGLVRILRRAIEI